MSRGLESGRVEGVLEIKVAEPQCWICEGLCVFVSSSGACTLQVGSGSRSQEECFFWPNVPAGLHRSRLGRSALLSLCTSSTPACLYVPVAPQPARQHPIAYNRHIPCTIQSAPPIGSGWRAAALASTVRDAVRGAFTSSRLGTALLLAALAPAMRTAMLRTGTSSCLGAAQVLAALAPAVRLAVRASNSGLGAALLPAALASTVRGAVRGAACSSRGSQAALLLAALAPATRLAGTSV
jgi:hypothetical protein